MTSNQKYVDLAALSMSGSLMPSVPVKLMLKYDPPKITLVYHFEHKEHDQYYHEIPVEKRMLETMSEEDLASHLYMSEAYYFNPKQIKRQQVLNLVAKLKQGVAMKEKNKEERRKNFFQRKRFVNYDMNMGVGSNNGDDEEAEEGSIEQHHHEGGIGPHSNSKQRNNIVEFEDDPVIGGGRAPSHSPLGMQQHQVPHHNHQINAPFPQPPSSHHPAAALHEELRRPVSKLPPLETKSQAFDMVSPAPQQQQHNNNARQQQPQIANQNSNQKSINGGYDDLLEMQDFDESDHYDSHHMQPQHLQMQQQPQFIEQTSPQVSVAQQQNLLDGGVATGFEMGGQEMIEGEEEEESVYIKDNVVMRRIQIEGEEQEYLMDPDGNIYDMQGNFIGTANANELEEMDEGADANGGQMPIHDEQNLIL